MELKEYLLIIRRRIWLIALIVVISCISTAVYSFYFVNPIYEASTKLIVNQTKESSGSGLDINTVNTDLRLIETYKEIIKTPAILDKVIMQYPELKLRADELVGKIKVNSVNNTQVMTLVVQDASYKKATEIVNAVSKTFRSEISTIMKVDNVTILNEADPNKSGSPVNMKPTLSIVISLLVSAMAAVGIVFLLEYLDDTIKSEADIQNVLGLPTLAIVSKVKKEDFKPAGSATSQQQVGDQSYVTVNH